MRAGDIAGARDSPPPARRSERPTAEEWRAACPGLQRHGDEWHGPCPACGGDDRFRVLPDGSAFCRQCAPAGGKPFADLLRAAGFADNDVRQFERDTAVSNGHAKPVTRLPAPDTTPPTTTRYEIRTHAGELVATHCRTDPGKRIWWEPKGVKATAMPLYRIEHELDHIGPVVITEGEKAADALAGAVERDLLVVGTVTGAAGTPHMGALEPLVEHARANGVSIYLWPDADDPGSTHMQRIGAALVEAGGPTPRLINWEGAPPKGDAADWVAAGQPPLVKLLEGAKPFDADQPDGLVVAPLDDPLPDCFAHACVELAVKLRHNVRSGLDEIYGIDIGKQADADGWASMTRSARRLLFSTIERKINAQSGRGNIKPWRVSSDSIRQDMIVTEAWATRVDPFLAWLESLPTWDQRYRIGSVLVDLFGQPLDADQDKRLTSLAMHLLLGTAVHRAYHPGAKQDITPVLIATEQGQGKSSLAARLLPADNRHVWFGDGLNLSMTRREVAEVTAGRVIMELPEMSGLRRAELATLKSWLTTTDDGQTRGAYKESAESKPRQWAGIGTCDKIDALPYDPAGHRRWLAVSIGDRTVMDMDVVLEPIRAQLWAEAISHYRDVAPVVPPELWEHIASQNRSYEAREPVAEERVAQLEATPWRSGASINDLMAEVGVDRANLTREAGNFGAALRAHGWDLKRVKQNGKQRRLWFPPRVTG